MIEGLILLVLGALLATVGVSPFKASTRREYGPHRIAPPISTAFPVAEAEPTLEQLALMADAALVEDQARRANGQAAH